MKRTFTFLMMTLLAFVGVVKAQTWLQPTVSTDTETYEYYIMNYRNQDHFVTTTSGLAGGAQQLGSAKEFTEGKAKVIFKLTEGGKLYSTNTVEELVLGYTTTEGSANSVQLFAADSEEGYIWNIEASANGGYTLCAGESSNSWNMHGGAGNNIGLYSKTDGGSNWVFVPANDAATAKAEEAVAALMPSTEYLYQIKNVERSRMLAANAEKATTVTTNSTADLNQLWAFEAGENGTFYLRNAGQQKYLIAGTDIGTAWTVGAEGTAFEVELQNYSKKSYALHAEGQDNYGNAHDANWYSNGGEQVVRWLASSESSQWYLEKTEISTTAKSINFVYSFTFDGVEKYSQSCAGVVGEAYPDVDASLFPYCVSATKPEGELTAEVEGTTVEIALTVAGLPFVAADDVANIENWYLVKMHSNQKKYIQYLADQTYIEWADTEYSAETVDSCSWAFVGNIFDGFKMVNKAATTDMALKSTGEGDVTMAAYAEGTQFVLAATSVDVEGGFCLRYPENNQYLNGQNGKVAHWGSTDAGSTFLLEVYSEELFDLTEVREAFEAQAAAFMKFGEGSAALFQLSALHTKYNEVMMAVEALYTAIYNGEKVLKSDVVAAMETMTAIKAEVDPVIAYYEGTYGDTWWSADDLLQTLDPESEDYATLDAALESTSDLSEVTTVEELEAMVAILEEVVNAINTGIDNIEAETETVIYDLAGRRVQKMEKGIYIVDGVKVVIK